MPGRNPMLYLSPLQHAVLDGCLLSDGCIAIRKNRTPSPRFEWGCIHRDLTQFVADSFFPIQPRVSSRKNDTGFATDKPLFMAHAPVSGTFAQQRARWYLEDGLKIVPYDLRLDRTACLFWYLGDGSLGAKRVNLSTQGFSWGDVEAVLLPKLHALGARSARAYPDDGKPRIYLSVADSARWLSFIGPPPVPSMVYKWEASDARLDA
jgi:hypothetical protein